MRVELVWVVEIVQLEITDEKKEAAVVEVFELPAAGAPVSDAL